MHFISIRSFISKLYSVMLIFLGIYNVSESFIHKNFGHNKNKPVHGIVSESKSIVYLFINNKTCERIQFHNSLILRWL